MKRQPRSTCAQQVNLKARGLQPRKLESFKSLTVQDLEELYYKTI